MPVPSLLPAVPFTTRHAERFGLDSHALTAAVRCRVVRRVLRGVYVAADVPDSIELRAQASSLVISRHSVLCDRSASWVWGCDVFRYRELDDVPPLEAYVLRGHDPTDRPECGGGTRDLWPCDWVEIGGVKVTIPIRTAMDLGCKLPRREAMAAMDALARAHGLSVDDMLSLLPRYFRRRGVVQLRPLVRLVDSRSESSGESWMRLELQDSGLPSPTPQFWVLVAGVPTYRLDLAYPHARVAIEYDGEEFHSSAEDVRRDEVRRRWLRENGWHVIVLTKASFTADAIDSWIGEVRRALARR